jgi:hypothetical protein
MPSHGQREQRRLSKDGCDDFGTREKRRDPVFVSSDNKKESLTHFKLPFLHMFGIFEDHAIVRLKVR